MFLFFLLIKLCCNLLRINDKGKRGRLCSTMGVGRQSRRVCFGAKPDKGFLDKKNLAVSGSGKGTRTRVDDATQRERVGGWTGEKAVAAGDHGGQWRLDKGEANREVGVEERRGSQHQTPSREARRQDRVQ